MENSPIVYFISGVSGVGKSSVIKYLKSLLSADEYDIRDFDERGVPAGGGHEWHNAETLYWLETAAENAELGKSTIVCGFVEPERFWKVYSKENHPPAQLVLLHASNDTIKKRLLSRYQTPESIAEISRAAGVPLDKFIEDILSAAPWLYDIFKKEGAPIIDTENKTPEEVAQEIVNLL
ncbi:MAG: AAA family ATPase [Patescibacteria group bacterium]|jgi:broad-specificity NMP kinase